jgi:hypothetical protein
MSKTKSPCQRLLDLISSAPERASALPAELIRHVETCAACQVEVHASTRLTMLLAQSDQHVAPAIDAAEIVNRAMADRGPRRTSDRPALRRAPWLLVPVAAAALVVAAVWIIGQRPGKPGAADGSGLSGGLVATRCERSVNRGPWHAETCAPSGVAMTGRGERARLTLSDQTTVWLNHSTQLRVLRDHARGLRLERGNALLDVVRQGKLPPLRVGVPTGMVKVVGTQLHITARSQAAIVDVLRGKVIVQSGGQTEAVTAGGEAVLSKDQAPLVQAAADLGTATEWADTVPAATQGTSGFGRLSARRPGKTEDTEQALRLTDHQVQVRIQGRVAKTVVTETFHNDTNHTLEGVYKFPLPANAKIAALDLVVNGKWEHGAMVERSRGDKIWRGVIRNATPRAKRHVHKDEYVWVPGPWHDPALLKWKKGSEFELRIFPIPKKGARTVRIAYTELLRPIPGGRRYVLPLAADPAGKPRAERFRFEAKVGGHEPGLELRASPYALRSRTDKHTLVLSLDQGRFAPTGDIVLDIPSRTLGKELTAWAYKSPSKVDDGYALLSLRPMLPAWSRRDPLKVVFVVDSSYSIQAARLARAAELVARVTRELGDESQVHLLACSDQCRALGPGFRPASKATAEALRRSVLGLEPLGSTRLVYAFEQAAALLAKAPGSGRGRVIYLGDGVPTVGELDPGRLVQRARLALGDARLTTVALGGHVDDVVLRGLARAGRGAYVAHGAGVSLRATAFRVIQRQWGEPLREVALKLPAGLHRVAPHRLGVLWPGEERLIAARVKTDAEGEVVLTGVIAGRAYERRYRVKLAPRAVAGNAFLPRLWAEQRIDDLQQQGDEHRKTIVALSKSHHVLSRHTSLLVLESPAMARAFKVTDTRPPTEWSGDEGSTESSTATVGGSGAGAPRARRAMSSGASLDDLMTRSAGAAKKSARRPPKARRSPMRPRDLEWRPRWRRGRRMIRMKKVWYRAATIGQPQGIWSYERTELRRREQRLADRPLSRDRTRDLVRWHVRLGDLAAAERLAKKWLAKDRLDAGALVELAGIAALQGNPDRSRDLLASAVDVDPRSAAAHTRMIELYRAAGNRDLRCAHALARALVSRQEWRHQVAAARCDSDVQRHVGHLAARVRKQAERALARQVTAPPLWERLKVDARWDTGPDLDVVVVSPRGRVISWQGGARRVRTADVHSLVRETLAASMEERGRYQIWMVPRAASRVTASSGTLRVRSYSNTRTLRFTSQGRPTLVADVNVKLKFRLVRAP